MTSQDIYKNTNIEDLKGEYWKDVPGFDGKYSASNLGRIKRRQVEYLTKSGRSRSLKTIILKQKITKKGYCQVALTNFKGLTKHKGVHRWVMYAFKGESSLQVDHINGIKTDNRLENLRYCTQRENINYRKDVNPDSFSSSFYGTYKDKSGGWASYIRIEDTNHYLGKYDTEYEAHSKYMKAWNDWKEDKTLPDKYINPSKTSIHNRVDFHNASGKWRVRDSLGNYIGIFKTESLALKVSNIIEFLIERKINISKNLIIKVRRKYGEDKRLREKIKNTVTGKVYHSIKEASEDTGINYSTLTNRLKQNRGDIKYVRE